MIATPPLPKLIRIKREAKETARLLFPPHDELLETVKTGYPETKYPLYMVDYVAQDRLKDALVWIRDHKNRIYKRPMSHLVYEIARCMIDLLQENATQKMKESWAKDWERERQTRSAAETMKGDGQGI